VVSTAFGTTASTPGSSTKQEKKIRMFNIFKKNSTAV
jgi:hypothetical protein